MNIEKRVSEKKRGRGRPSKASKMKNVTQHARSDDKIYTGLHLATLMKFVANAVSCSQ